MTEDDKMGPVGTTVIHRDGRWFIVGHAPDTGTSRPVAGPYRTEAAARRWTDDHPPPVGTIAITVRCHGGWEDAITHAEAWWLVEKRATVINGPDDEKEDDE